METLNVYTAPDLEASAQITADDGANSRLNEQIEAACAQACQAIAPAWPLDRAIAVNPHWSRIGMPIRQVAARMAVLGGIQVFPPRERQKQAWAEGRIQPQDLNLALNQFEKTHAASPSKQECLAALENAPAVQQLPLLIDVLDNDPERHTRLSWRQAITHQVSQTCAAYFDEHQADWQPERSQGLYAFWRDTLQHDHGIGILMGLPQLGHALEALPASRQDAERWVLQRLGLPQTVWADYLEAVLLTVNGWASWCAYLGWQAHLQGHSDSHLRELLAIRLAWGAILLECKDDSAASQAFLALQREWGAASTQLQQAENAFISDEVWQIALELGYQRSLAQKLQPKQAEQAKTETIEAQAAFCIDVRSERLRRALETVSPSVQTMGFAGFFGLPVAYTPLGTQARRPQLPGLLAPAMEVVDHVISANVDARKNDANQQEAAAQARLDRFSLANQWLAASRWPGAAFSFVEAAGISYLGKLGRWLNPGQKPRAREDLLGLPARYRSICRPQISGLTLEDKIALGRRVLQAMGFSHFAPLVLLVGHGSQSSNNAHSAGLDCGACGGQTGEVNARSLAQLLNDSAVRQGLKAQGLDIPVATAFVAALHNTTTDEIEVFDLDLLTEASQKQWERLNSTFSQAAAQVRRERAAALGLNPALAPDELLKQLVRRANDGSQTRPEWGLAGNAAFLIAPRQRSLGLNLEGRCFLHDYEHQQDSEGKLLELLMTAPMLVTHWINWQYHASTCDPARLGSGNKVLHNVVGGQIGVFEGNGGDLRIGLSRQSLYDGERWVHEPLRLTVIIDAPQHQIDRVIQQHPTIQQLLDNHWLHLWRFDETGLQQYQRGTWQALEHGGN